MTLETFTTTVELVPGNEEPIDDFLDRAYQQLRDFNSFPEHMENVKAITEEIEDDETFHSWRVLIDDAEFQWKQKTAGDAATRTVEFSMVDGDFEHLEGAWRVVRNDSKCELQLAMTYSIGLPVIEDVLGPILREKLQSNSNTMLNRIKQILEHGE